MVPQYENPSEYIDHHLTFFTKQIGEGGFWTLNMDTIAVSIILGIIGLGFFRWIAVRMTQGVPGKTQAFVEWFFLFVTNQVRSVYHGDPHRFVAPLAFTVLVWVILLNSMDFLPADLVTLVTSSLGFHHGFRVVPTADVNTTFALALTAWALMVGAAFRSKGVGGYMHELFCAPFGTGPWWAAPFMFVLNFVFNLIELVSKPLSHSLRLFGNMYAGEIIFLLLWMLATASLAWAGASILLAWVWAMFHILIVLLQAYIFMMLTVVYVQMGQESH
jgi:F-type H+-transporting ATPase subunit a